MTITIFAYICLIIMIVSIIFKNKYILLYSAIFFSGFTGTSIVNINSISIQPSYFLFVLFIVFSINKLYKFKVDKVYLVFLLYCIINSFFPIVLSSRKIVLMLQSGKYGLLSYGKSNLIHIGYLIFTFIFFTYLFNIRKDELKNNIFKAYKYGLFAFIFVTLYQIIAFKFHLPFDEIFRQSIHGNIQGTRIYGPCIEASMMSYYLAPSLLFLWFNKKNFFDLLMFLIGIFIGFMSYSSTFFIGFVVISIIIALRFIIIFQKPIAKNKLIISMLIFIIFVSCLVLNINYVQFVFNSLIEKIHIKNTSGIERSQSFNIMLNIGINYPLGVGFGASRSKDLFSTWACNIGFLGLFIFFAMVVYFFYNSLKKHNKYIYAYLLTVLLMMISVPEPYALFIQVLLYFGTVNQVNNLN